MGEVGDLAVGAGDDEVGEERLGEDAVGEDGGRAVDEVVDVARRLAGLGPAAPRLAAGGGDGERAAQQHDDAGGLHGLVRVQQNLKRLQQLERRAVVDAVFAGAAISEGRLSDCLEGEGTVEESLARQHSVRETSRDGSFQMARNVDARGGGSIIIVIIIR